MKTRVAQATCEVKVLSCFDGVNKLEYLADFMSELNIPDYVSKPSIIFNDNQSREDVRDLAHRWPAAGAQLIEFNINLKTITLRVNFSFGLIFL